ncbi:MAG TPA: enoyl-CoA hydratase/isomerase family protein [Candidatus Lokiarchaeia archaeon]|nr:enoyl-CoA hydratase/isomerase family protein [Candidatus Lokiarchaeia archaeon]
MADYETFDYEVEEEVAWITFNRPEKRNPLSRKVWTELMDVMLKTQDDINIRVLVITGQDPAFSAGLDIKELSTVEFQGLGDFLNVCLDPNEVMMRYPKPIIAAINGFAYAGGLELTLFCDEAIASEQAKMGFYENRRGLASGIGFLYLPELIGMRKTKELLLTGKIIDANEAYRMGLVNKVVPHEQLHEAVMEEAREMKKVAPLSHKWTKKWFFEGGHLAMHKNIGSLWATFWDLFHSEDVIEGFTAFMEDKRDPVWKGK